MTNNFHTIVPEDTILLVMDYQSGILNRLGDVVDVLLSRMAKVIDTARNRGIKIGYIRVAFEDADYESLPKTNKIFSKIKVEHLMQNKSPGTAIHKKVAPKPGDIIIRKTRVGAFSTTDLDKQLRDNGINTLILAGISTSGVVLSTVRDAADKDYRIFVLADCCMDSDIQVHDALITKVFPRQAEIIDSTMFSQTTFII
jgi:nicotinamidase-related amidase